MYEHLQVCTDLWLPLTRELAPKTTEGENVTLPNRPRGGFYCKLSYDHLPLVVFF